MGKNNDNIKNFVGVLFFTAFYKIENFKEYAKIEYNYFTDIEFDFNNFNLITDMKQFFITEFINFLFSAIISTSIVGFPRESKISIALTFFILNIII